MLLRLTDIHFEKTKGQIRNALLIDIHKLGYLSKLVEMNHAVT